MTSVSKKSYRILEELKGETMYSTKYTIDIIRRMMQELSDLVQNKPVLLTCLRF